MTPTRIIRLPGGRILLAVACAALLAGVARAQDPQPRTTTELRRDLKETEREIKTIQDLQRKLTSAGRESSNTARHSAVDELREHMGDCIVRREDALGMEHTIKMHGQAVKGGTTEAAEVGAPVGTSRSKQVKNLTMNDGPNADRLRRLSMLQSLYVSAVKIERSAVEKQGDAYDSYLAKVARFEKELVAGRDALAAELAEREPAPAGEEEKEGGAESAEGGDG